MATKQPNADPEADGFAGPVDDTESFFEDAPTPTAYDPTMDPGSPRWSPKKFFEAQPKEIIVLKRSASDVLGDPSGERELTQSVGINGHSIRVPKGVPVSVPRDFAELLVSIGAAYRVGEIRTLA